MYKRYWKRIFDLAVSFILLFLLSPFILVIGLLLTYVNNGKPFFAQSRPGKYEQQIRVFKFKSMTDEKGADGKLLPDNQRLTKVGAFIRKTSLDELPQLVNVLKGDMSLVGPRPLLYKYLPLYSEEQRRRHDVRPGITGWAQVNGRNSISWTEKFAYDIYYIDHLSFCLDMKILFLTLKKVFKQEGINQSAKRPMAPFNGHN